MRYVSLLMQDSRVRFSAAKGLARVAAKLPEDLRAQIVEALLEQLTEHVRLGDIPPTALMPELPETFDAATIPPLDALDLYAVSDCTWHGVFLALAECTRRALIPTSLLCRTLYWVLCGLLFDLRRGASSVGSNVRDACCYVLWAMARVRHIDTLAPCALSVAQRLLVVATLDRDVSIRRAASAAFQEWVGRTPHIPHGIAVLRETDFAAVGVRRNAYTVCAPRIAQYSEYRSALLGHLQRICLSYWDADVRKLGALAFGQTLPLEGSAHEAIVELVAATQTSDPNVVHGALMALVSVCNHITNPALAQVALSGALHIPPRLFSTPGGAMVLEAACLVVAAASAQQARHEAVLKLLTTATARTEPSIHEAAACAVEALGDDAVVHTLFSRMLDAWTTSTPDEQRAGVLALGSTCSLLLPERRALLCDAVQHGVDVETRRNAAAALPHLLRSSLDEYESLLAALVHGLDDYTTDQRGDVGSWVRAQCMQSLRTALLALHAKQVEPENLACIAQALSAGLAERIDSVRSTACLVLADLASVLPLPAQAALQTALDAPEATFRDAHTAFPRIIPLLCQDAYRASLLPTLARTIGSRSETAVRIVAHPAPRRRACARRLVRASQRCGRVCHLLRAGLAWSAPCAR